MGGEVKARGVGAISGPGCWGEAIRGNARIDPDLVALAGYSVIRCGALKYIYSTPQCPVSTRTEGGCRRPGSREIAPYIAFWRAVFLQTPRKSRFPRPSTLSVGERGSQLSSRLYQRPVGRRHGDRR